MKPWPSHGAKIAGSDRCPARNAIPLQIYTFLVFKVFNYPLSVLLQRGRGKGEGSDGGRKGRFQERTRDLDRGNGQKRKDESNGLKERDEGKKRWLKIKRKTSKRRRAREEEDVCCGD